MHHPGGDSHWVGGGASAPTALPRGLWPPAAPLASLLTAPAPGSLHQPSPCNAASQTVPRGHSALGAQTQPPLAPQHPQLKAKLPHIWGAPLLGSPMPPALSRPRLLMPLWAGPGLPRPSAICDAWYPLPRAARKHHLSPSPRPLPHSRCQARRVHLGRPGSPALGPSSHALTPGLSQPQSSHL